MFSLGALLRETGQYVGMGERATYEFDAVVITDDNIIDAKNMAGKEGDYKGFLIQILMNDFRIPLSGYDPEQVDP